MVCLLWAFAGCGGSGENAAPLGQCANDGDQTVFDELASQGGEDGPGAVSGAATACGLSGCGGALGTLVVIDSPANREALSTCVASCLVDDLGLSPGCAGCYGDVTACSAGACSDPCISDSTSEACRTCAEDNCVEAFGNCI